jgi:hypothetical protein
MSDCSDKDCPFREKCSRRQPPTAKKEHSPNYDSPLPKDDENRQQAVDRVPCGGGYRVLRRPRLLDSE